MGVLEFCTFFTRGSLLLKEESTLLSFGKGNLPSKERIGPPTIKTLFLIIIGTLLGDGCMEMYKSGGARLISKHSM
jgi:hypothetical protein